MSSLAPADWQIALVESLTDTDEETIVQLHTKKQVKLAKRCAERLEIYQRLEDSVRRQIPIGIWLDREDHVRGAGWAERDFLLSVQEHGPNPGWAWVYFATGGSYPLRISNPEYHRILQTVQRCRESRSPAWLVTKPRHPGVELVEVCVLSPEEDELLCRVSNVGWV